MTRTEFPGAWYVDATPGGRYCAALRGRQRVLTHEGNVSTYPRDLLFVRCAMKGPFRFAGQEGDRIGHQGDGNYEYPAGVRVGASISVSPVIYDLNGALLQAQASHQGFRYMDLSNQPVTGDASYGPFHGLFEYSSAGPDLWIGQAAYDGGGVQVWDGAALRQLALGDCRFIRVQYDGDLVAVSFAMPDRAVILQTTMGELRALPLVEAPEPEPVPPGPEPPDPPTPEPPKPEPPHPEPPPVGLPAVVPYHGGRMDPEQGWLVGPGDKVLSVAADGAVTFQRTQLTDADLFELTKPDDRYGLEHVHTGLWLGADATKHTPTGNVCQQFYALPSRNGNYESWTVGRWPSGIVSAVIEYIQQGADNGRSWQSAGLTWVKK